MKPEIDHTKDQIPGVDCKLSWEETNKYHGVFISALLGIVVWIVSAFVGAAILIGAYFLLMLIINSIDGVTNWHWRQHIDLVGYGSAVGFLLIANLLSFGVPYVFFLCYRTNPSFWASLKYTLWGSIIDRFTSGGGPKISSRGIALFYD